MPHSNNNYITTSEACDLIGVSKTVVKRLADEGVLKTWKTPGGHRRLLKDSVEEYIAVFNNQSNQFEENRPSHTPESLKVLIVEDDPTAANIISGIISSLGLNISINIAEDGYDGLMKVGNMVPDIIFSDLNMPKMNGYTMINSIRGFEPTEATTIIIITGEETDSIDRSMLPSDVVIMNKPVQPDILKSFVNYEYNLKFS